MASLISSFRLLGGALLLASLVSLSACSSAGTPSSGSTVGTPIGRGAGSEAASISGPISGGGMPGSAGVGPSMGSGGPR